VFGGCKCRSNNAPQISSLDLRDHFEVGGKIKVKEGKEKEEKDGMEGRKHPRYKIMVTTLADS